MAKKLTREEYLSALALFTMAKSHSRQADAFYQGCIDLLECEDNGHVSDAVYGFDGPSDIKLFNDAIRKEGFVVPIIDLAKTEEGS